MFCHVRSLGLQGLNGYEVLAECDLSNGLPAFDVVGLPDAAVKEARNRVRSAARNCGFPFPSPASQSIWPPPTAEGGHGLRPAHAGGHSGGGWTAPPPPAGAAFVGELSLAGALRPVTGMLPMALAARRAGITSLYVPADSRRRGHPGRRAHRLPGGGCGAAGAPSAGEEPLVPAPPWVPGDPSMAEPRLCRREGAGPGQAGPGDRRSRGTQPLP